MPYTSKYLDPAVEEPPPQESYPTPPPDEAPGVAPSEYTIIETPTQAMDITEGSPTQGDPTDQPAIAQTPSAGVNDVYQPGQGDFRTQTGTTGYTSQYLPTDTATPDAGPVQGAANAVGGFISGNVVPALQDHVPQGVQDAVAPRASGAVGVVGQVGQAAGQAADALINLDPGGAIAPIMDLGNAPVTYESERQGQAAATGQGLVPSPGDILQDPSKLYDVVPGAVNTGPVGQALVGTSLDDYAQTPEGQQAYQEGGGAGLYDSWKKSGGIDYTPPASIVNPLDNTSSPGDVIGNIPAAVGSVYAAGQKGELNPFLRGLAIDTLNDPSLAAQVALGVASGGTSFAGEAAGRAGLEGVASGLGKITAAGRAANRTADVVLDPITNTVTEAIRPVAKGIGNVGGLLAPSRSSREATAAERIVEAGSEYLPTTRNIPAEAPAAPVIPGPDTPSIPGNEAAIPHVTPQPTAAAPSPIRDLFASPVNASEPIPGINFPRRPAETRPVPGAPRLREVSPTTGRPIIAPGSRPNIEVPLRQRLDSLGLSDVGVRLVNDLRDVNPRSGPLDQALYRGKEKLIYLSLDASRLDELPRLIDHEAIHALSDLGLFKGGEYRTLVRAADDMGLRESIAKRYPELDKARLDNEMVAELYTRHRAGQKVPGFATRVLDRIGQFLRNVGLSIRDTYPENVLRRIDSGEVGRRTRAQQASDAAFTRLYHGSQTSGLATLRADMSVSGRRDPSVAFSDLGVFMTPNRNLAEGYANGGTVYEAASAPTNPARFDYHQFYETYRDERTPALTAQVQALKQDLIAQGHDGIELALPDGTVMEVASFNDVPVSPADAFARATRELSQPRDPGPTPENQQVKTSFGNLSAAHRNKIGETLLNGQTIGPHSDPTSIATETVLGDLRPFKFGGQNTETMTVRDALLRAKKDVDQWAQMAADPGSRVEKTYDRLGRQVANVAPGVDPASLAGEANAWKRDLLASEMVADAHTAALPKVQRATGTLGMAKDVNDAFLNYRRRVGLFNYLNIPRFALQQHLGNTISTLIGGKPVSAFHIFTNFRDYPDVFRALQKEGATTLFTDDLQRKMGAGVIKGVSQVDRASLGVALRGGTPKEAGFWGKAGRVLAPDSLVNVGKVNDTITRHTIYADEVFRGYRTMNADLPRMVTEWSQKYGLPYTDGQIREATSKFLDRNRTILDGNTNEPHSGLLGKVDKYEPVYSANDFRTFLREDLPKIPGSPIPDPTSMDLLVRRAGADVANNVKVIQQTAEDEMNRLAFDWKNTNVEEAAQNVFMYGYWMSHAGGLYVKQMLKNPAAFAAYGRLMTGLQEQADAMDAPPWMKGFFQFANTPGGFSLWLSPFDLFSTLLTFGDWQMETGGPDFRDLTWLGKGRSDIPFMLNPLVDMVGLATGAFGPDATVPDLLGLNKFTTQFGDLLNLANANGQLPQWVTDAGIGRDAMGNPVPIPTKPFDELYGRFANGLSTALKGITGLKPVPVPNVGRSQKVNMTYIVEQNLRINNPAMAQADVNKRVAEIMADPGSAEFGQAYRQLADMPYMTGQDTPNLLGGLLRTQSPIQTLAFPEQRLLDSTVKGLQPGGNVPPRNLAADDPNTKYDEHSGDFYDAKDAASQTLPAMQLQQRASDFYDQIDSPLDEIAKTDASIYYANKDAPREGSVTIGGVEYQYADLATYDTDTLRGLSAQYLADNGTNWDEVKAARDAKSAAYDNLAQTDPVLSGYFDMKSAANAYDGGQLGYVQDMMLANPSYQDYVLNHAIKDGAINTGSALTTDGYLAMIGVPPSVYDSVVPPPTTTANPQTQQQPVTVREQTDVLPRNDPNQARIGVMGPGRPAKLLAVQGDWSQVDVSAGDYSLTGWVPTSSLATGSGAPPQDPTITPPSGIAGALGSLVQGGAGALGGLAGGIGSALGGIVNAPAPAPAGPAMYDVVPAVDGLGVQSTRDGSDRTWMENMLGGQAKVTTEYKAPVADQVWQDGHGADVNTHAAYDIGLEGGGVEGTPFTSPVSGTVVCSGYGNGTGGSLGGCTYSQKSTSLNSDGTAPAHTVVIEVGKDSNGNPIQMSFNHVGTTSLQPGQTVNVGDPLGTMGNTPGGPHIHVEGWLGDPATGYQIVDPQLIVGGYYSGRASASPAPPPSYDVAPFGGIGDALGSLVSGIGGLVGGGGSSPYTPQGFQSPALNAPEQAYGAVRAGGGDWSVLDQFDPAYLDASNQVLSEKGVDVPPDLIKAVNAMESGYGQINPPTGDRELRGKHIAGFVGMFDDAAASWGVDFNRATTDPAYAIYSLGTGLATIANWDAGNYPEASGTPGRTILDQYGWDGVLSVYYSGQPDINAPQPADDTTTIKQYVDQINALRAQVS